MARPTLQNLARRSQVSYARLNDDENVDSYLTMFSWLFNRLCEEFRLDICQAAAGGLLFASCQMQLAETLARQTGATSEEDIGGLTALFFVAGEKAMADTVLQCS